MKALALVLPLVMAVAPAARAENLGTLQASWPAQNVDRIQLKFPVGELVVVAGDAPTIRALMTVRCQRGGSGCVERSKRLKLTSRQSGRTRLFKVEGYPKFNNGGLQVELRVEVPRSVSTHVEMGVGEVVVEGVEGDLSVELGVGEVDVAVRESNVRSVNLAVGIGDATLDHPGHDHQRRGFLGKHVRWDDGAGRSRVHVAVGVGDASVRMAGAD